MTTLAALQSLVAQGASETLEFKRSTAEPKRTCEILCAFLNDEGGKVLIGVGPNGRLVGQEVADITLRDIAAMLGRFEPPARVEMSRSRQRLLSTWDAPRPKLVPRVDQVQIIEIAQIARSLPELMAPSGLKNKTRFRDQVMAPPARGRAARDDHPRKAAKLEAEVPHDGCRAGGPRDREEGMTHETSTWGCHNERRSQLHLPPRNRPLAELSRDRADAERAHRLAALIVPKATQRRKP